MKEVVSNEHELTEVLRRITPGDGPGLLYIFDIGPDPRDQPTPTEITFAFRSGEVKSIFEDARKYHIKMDALEKQGRISSIANLVTDNHIGAIVGKLGRGVTRKAIEEEYQFAPFSFRWAVARLYELGWRVLDEPSTVTLTLSAEPLGRPRLAHVQL